MGLVSVEGRATTVLDRWDSLDFVRSLLSQLSAFWTARLAMNLGLQWIMYALWILGLEALPRAYDLALDVVRGLLVCRHHPFVVFEQLLHEFALFCRLRCSLCGLAQVQDAARFVDRHPELPRNSIVG